MTNDPFTEWLTNRFLFYRRRKNDLLLSEKERIQAEAKETECADCIYQYRSLAPTWIPVTPETMPERGRRVLCTGPDGVIRFVEVVDSYGYRNDYYTHWLDVTLPAPPTK